MQLEEAFAPRRALRRGWNVIGFRKTTLWPALAAALMWIFECTPTPTASNMPPPPDVESYQEEGPDSEVVVDLGDGVDAEEQIRTRAERRAARDLQAAQFVSAVLLLFLIRMVIIPIEAWFHPGYLRLQASMLRGDPPVARVLASGRDRFLKLWGWKLLWRVIAYPAIFVFAVPSMLAARFGAPPWVVMPILFAGLLALIFFVGTGLALGSHAVVFENRGPVDALKRSWAIARGNRVQIAWFLIATGLFQLGAFIIGVLALCVGAFVTVPVSRAVADTALTDAWLGLTRSGPAARR